jgi:hypothetical protein
MSSLIGLTVDPNTYDITILRGDDQTVRFTVTTSTGAAQDVTGWSFKFTVKSSLDDAIGLALFQKTTGGGGIVLTTPASGIVDVSLSASDTQAMSGKYFYDLQGVDLTGLTKTVRAAIFYVRKDVTTPGVAGLPAQFLFTAQGSTGSASIYSTLQAAMTYAGTQASAANPWTVKMLPGVYSMSAVLNCANLSYVTLQGSGIENTLLLRSTALTDSGGSIRLLDPVVDFSGSTRCAIADMTIEHDGTMGANAHPCGLVISNSTGFRATNLRILSSYVGVEAQNTVPPSGGNDATQNTFTGCKIVVVNAGDGNADTFYTTKCDIHFYNCYMEMSATANGPDCLFAGANERIVIIGCEFVRRQTGGAAGIGRVMVTQPVSSGNATKIYAVGSRFYNDWSAGDINSATGDCTVIDITGAGTADTDISFDGCKIDYESGALTSARTLCGLQVGQGGGSGTAFTVRLNGTEIRDLGGSGATNRKDIMILVSASGGVKQPKAIYVTGGKVSSWGYRSNFGTPAVSHTSMVVREPTANYQTGSATLNAGTPATVAVTLPVAYPTMSTAVADYNVILEFPTNPGTESFWVSGKTNTGFTINSTLNGSTTVIRWTVLR